MPFRTTEPRIRTLRRKLLLWAALALAAVIASLTAATVVEERRLLSEIHAASGASLLSHLIEMPEFRGDVDAARHHVELLSAALRPAGVTLLLEDPSAPAPEEEAVVAAQPVRLSGLSYELRYAVDRSFVSALARRSAVTHVLHGLVALVVSLLFLDGIVRAKLVRPLHEIAHQIRFMRGGGGWEPHLPSADAEISEVADALRDLGPALHDQVRAWVEAERRSGVAQAFSRVRIRLRDPKRRALALLGDVQARNAVSPEAKPKLRAVVAEIDRLTREIEEEEEALLRAPTPAPSGRPGDAA